MKALTLTQPYASLVAENLKRWETRSWRTNYRGPLAIHAAKSYNGVGGTHAFDRLMLDLPVEAIARLGGGFLPGPLRLSLPMGAIVAISWLEECEPAEDVARALHDERLELALGNYAAGRWAWKLREPISIVPVPIDGMQGLWEIPDELLPAPARLAIRHPGHG